MMKQRIANEDSQKQMDELRAELVRRIVSTMSADGKEATEFRGFPFTSGASRRTACA